MDTRNVKKMSEDALRYVAQDCLEAILAMPSNQKAEAYLAELYACTQELIRRHKS